jgi:hypothetical protein
MIQNVCLFAHQVIICSEISFLNYFQKFSAFVPIILTHAAGIRSKWGLLIEMAYFPTGSNAGLQGQPSAANNNF